MHILEAVDCGVVELYCVVLVRVSIVLTTTFQSVWLGLNTNSIQLNSTTYYSLQNNHTVDSPPVSNITTKGGGWVDIEKEGT